MEITTVGLDIAKRVFQLHGVDAAGKAVLRRKLQRSEVLAFFKALPPCLVGIEACGTARVYARRRLARGYLATEASAPHSSLAFPPFLTGSAGVRGHRQLVRSVSGLQAIGLGLRFIANPCCRFRPRPGTFGPWRLCLRSSDVIAAEVKEVLI